MPMSSAATGTSRTATAVTSNGCGAAPPATVCDTAASTVAIEVRDTGPGIDPELAPTIFERFVRLDEARSRDAGGSGLGLAIARGIAASGHGTLTVDDSRWGGARFVLTLPLGA